MTRRSKEISETEVLSLLDSIANKDPLAMEQFYHHFSCVVYQFALNILNRSADASEVLDESFLEVWKKANTYSKQSTVTTWLLSIAYFKCAELIKRKTKQISIDSHDVVDVDEEKPTVEAFLEQSESGRDALMLIKNVTKQTQEKAAIEAPELGWRRLKKHIDVEVQKAKSAELSTKVKASMPTWAASLGVAAMLVVAMQLTFVFQPAQESDIDTELLNSLNEPHWLIQVAFEPSANWSDISKTLESVNADIIRGPSNLGLIRAAIPKGNERFEEAQAVLGWLKTQTSIAHVALEDG